MGNTVEITQFMRPDGRNVKQHLEVDAETFLKCESIRSEGYRFECEILMDGGVSMTITDDEQDHEIELVRNIPGAFLEGFVAMTSRFADTLA